MINCLRYPIRERFLSKAALALDLFLLLWWLPFILLTLSFRVDGRPVVGPFPRCRVRGQMHHAISQKPGEFLDGLCALTRMGYPVVIHFGVMKDEKSLHGHSWVTIEGNPVADTVRGGLFKAVYSHSQSTHPWPLLIVEK